MAREPIRHHRSFQHLAMQRHVLRGVSRRFHRLSPCDGQVAHALRTLPPVAAIVLLQRAAPRLACVKPAASVHPEPGSNSSLYILIFLSLTWRFVSLRNWRSRSFCFGTCFLVLSLSILSMIYRYFPNGLQIYALFSSLQTFSRKISKILTNYPQFVQ